MNKLSDEEKMKLLQILKTQSIYIYNQTNELDLKINELDLKCQKVKQHMETILNE